MIATFNSYVMNSILRAKIILVFVIMLATQKTLAQFTPSKWEIGINVGTLIYQGDLSESSFGYTNSLKPSVELWVSKSLDPYFSIRANLLQGSLGADESTYATPAYRRHRNLMFNSFVTEVSAALVWDVNGKTYREGMRRFSPYLFAGVGFAILHVNRNWSRFDTNYFNSQSTASLGLGMDTLHTTPTFLPVIPVGAGLRYMVTNQIFINAEVTYRITSSDYIDGFSYSANPNKNDHYYGLTLGVSYRFGWTGINCPKIVL
jgi:opacity protein-like surface antigen